MNVTIRRLQSDDAALYRDLRLSSLAEDPTAFLASRREDEARPMSEWRTRLGGATDSAVFGAFANDALVGICGVHRPSRDKVRHRAQIWGMYVAPETRRHGAGRALLRAAIEHARSIPAVDVVTLSVNCSNLAARSLYIDAGFVPWGIDCDAFRVDGVAQDEEYMRRTFESRAPH